MRQQTMFHEPLKPPVDGQVLRIARWREVFETAHSRKNKVLTWISCPVSFNSTGYQKLLDHHDEWTAAALYGGWLALCQLAAQSELRGVLCGQKGEAYNTRRIARLTGLGVEIFEALLPWALSVGWLEWARPEDDYSQFEPAESSTRELCEVAPGDVDSESIPNVGIDDSEFRTLPNPTQPNQTKPNPTQLHTTPATSSAGGEGDDFVSLGRSSEPAEGRTADEQSQTAVGQAPACQTHSATPEPSWSDVKARLAELGVKAVSKAIRAAQAERCSVRHCLALCEHAKRIRAKPVIVYERFQLSSTIPAEAGWSATGTGARASPEHDLEQRRIRALERQTQETLARARTRKSAATAEPNGLSLAAQLKQRLRTVQASEN